MIRKLGIYFSILYISVGALIWGLLIFLATFFFKKKFTYLKARNFTSQGIRIYLNSLSRFGLINIAENTLPSLDNETPKIFIANHSSLFDILFFIAKYPNCTCIVKEALARYSPYSIIIYYSKYIISSTDSDVTSQAIAELEKGNSVVVFPEGTRSDARSQTIAKSSTSKINPFQRGASSISVRSKVAIVPVLITYDPPALGRGFRMRDLPNRCCEVKIKAFKEIIPPEGKDYSILAREFNQELEDFYKEIFNVQSNTKL